MQARVVWHARWGLFGALFILSAPGVVRGDFPFPFSAVTPHSAAGSFGLYFGNAAPNECRSWVAQLGFEAGQPLRTRELAPCEFAVTPLSPLAPGRHCLRPLWEGEPAPCIDVTGRVADPSVGSVAVALRYEGSGQGVSCYLCEGSGEQACTRQERQLVLKVSLAGAPAELAASFAFAVHVSSRIPAPDELPPAADEFRLLGQIEELYYPTRPPADGDDWCATLYAQPFEGGAPIRLGSACLGPQGPLEGPRSYFVLPQCLVSHWQHWCADNRADCQGPHAAQLWTCRSYDSICATEPDPALINLPDPTSPGMSTDVAVSDSDAATQATDAEVPDAGAGPRGPSNSENAAGCNLARGRSDTWLVLLLALSSLSLLRRRFLPRGRL